MNLRNSLNHIKRFAILRKADDAPASKEFEIAKREAKKYAYDLGETKELLNKATMKARRKKKGPLIQSWQYLTALIRMTQAYLHGEYSEIPWESIVLSIAAIVYFVSPIDFIPDFIPLSGYLDDAAIIAFIVKSIKTDLDNFLQWEAELKERMEKK